MKYMLSHARVVLLGAYLGLHRGEFVAEEHTSKSAASCLSVLLDFNVRPHHAAMACRALAIPLADYPESKHANVPAWLLPSKTMFGLKSLEYCSGTASMYVKGLSRQTG
jgi:hypothetical protein